MKIVKVDVVDGGKNKKGKKLDPKFVGRWGCDCGRAISEDYRFCPGCGKPVKFLEDAVVPVPALMPQIQDAVMTAFNAYIKKNPQASKSAADSAPDGAAKPANGAAPSSPAAAPASPAKPAASGDFEVAGGGKAPTGPQASGDFVNP